DVASGWAISRTAELMLKANFSPYHDSLLQPLREKGITGRDVAAAAENGDQLAQNVLRSEELTSELQSPCKLVCRLLLEKKSRPVIERWDGQAAARIAQVVCDGERFELDGALAAPAHAPRRAVAIPQPLGAS